MSLAVVGDFFAGGAIGYGIDAATGAQRRLVPEKVEVRLQPLTARQENYRSRREDRPIKIPQRRKVDNRLKNIER